MPLTPEDVANKQFTSTRLKPGYDETEVDEFLDEVEAELTRLYRENDELRSKAGAGAGGGGSDVIAPVAPEGDPAMARENEELRAKLGAAQRQLAESAQRAATSQQVAPAAQSAPAAAPAGGVEGATGILALAQRTADEHVAEARTHAERIVGEARTRADQLKREADEKHRQAIGSLEAEKVTLERKVEELRAFEREYRTRLKSYLEGQLRELEGRDTQAPAGSRDGGQGPGGQGQGGQGQGGQSGPGGQGDGKTDDGRGGSGGQPGRGPFSAGAPVGGGDPPSGPPQQPSSGYRVDEGSDQKE